MISVTINMSQADMEFIKNELKNAELNTQLPKDPNEPIDREKIELANNQITHILAVMGW